MENLPKQKPYRLTFEDAVNVWIEHWPGKYQHQIAADYGANPGRVNDVLKERKHYGSKAAAAAKYQAAA
jgi:hypothetical protein